MKSMYSFFAGDTILLTLPSGHFLEWTVMANGGHNQRVLVKSTHNGHTHYMHKRDIQQGIISDRLTVVSRQGLR